MISFQFAGVFDQRDGTGDALVATAGIDNDRKLTAVHAGVGACGRPCFGAGGDVISAGAQENGADVGAVVTTQSFLRDGRVIADLPVQDIRDVRNVYGGDEVPDVLHVEKGAIRAGVILAIGGRRCVCCVFVFRVRRFSGRLIQDASVFFDQDDIGVGVQDADPGAVAVFIFRYDDVEDMSVVNVLHIDPDIFQEGPDLFYFLFRNL